jgi:hypothetical protein
MRQFSVHYPEEDRCVGEASQISDKTARKIAPKMSIIPSTYVCAYQLQCRVFPITTIFLPVAAAILLPVAGLPQLRLDSHQHLALQRWL